MAINVSITTHTNSIDITISNFDNTWIRKVIQIYIKTYNTPIYPDYPTYEDVTYSNTAQSYSINSLNPDTHYSLYIKVGYGYWEGQLAWYDTWEDDFWTDEDVGPILNPYFTIENSSNGILSIQVHDLTDYNYIKYYVNTVNDILVQQSGNIYSLNLYTFPESFTEGTYKIYVLYNDNSGSHTMQDNNGNDYPTVYISGSSPISIDGYVYIYTGQGSTGWQKAIPYIYTEQSIGWQKATPYIYNGSTWKKCIE